MIILVVLIPAVVAVGFAVLAAVLYGTGGLWLVQGTATSRHARSRQASTRGAPAAPGIRTEPHEEMRRAAERMRTVIGAAADGPDPAQEGQL